MLDSKQPADTARNTSQLTSRKALYGVSGLMLIVICWGLWRWQQPVPAAYVAAPVKVAMVMVSNQPFIRYLDAIGELVGRWLTGC